MARGSIDISDREFEKLSRLIHEHSGIKLKDSKKGLVRSRLNKRLRELGLNNFSDYYERVFKDHSGEELSRLIDAISTNVTSFFRESKHFDFLADQVLPQIARWLKGSPNSYCHFWSAACSTGQEVYTLAMTLLENMERPSLYDIKILGTDINREAIRTALQGVYPYKAVESVNKLIVKRYFDTITNDEGKRMVRVKPSLKKLARFGNLNLNRKKPFPFNKKFDVIFCRNVLIYFDPPVVERLVQRFYRHMKKGGYLFVGHSESLTRVKHPFEYVKATVYRKK